MLTYFPIQSHRKGEWSESYNALPLNKALSEFEFGSVLPITTTYLHVINQVMSNPTFKRT
jgi:hypothetical protein